MSLEANRRLVRRYDMHSPRPRLPRVVLSLLLAACASESTPATPPVDTATASAALQATLDGWYTAMQRQDSAGIVAPLTPGFLLLEDTLPLSAPELVARLKEDTSGTQWKAEFSDFRTRFAGDVAWTTLRNHETSVAKDSTRCSADFLETIVFMKDGERWLIDRYHAAAVRRWSCSE